MSTVETAKKNIEKQLDLLCQELLSSCGENIRSLVLYGGAAKEDFDTETSNLNLMIVCNKLGAAESEKLNMVLLKHQRQLPLALFMLTEADFRSSIDLFPIKFQDMKRNHKTLYGEELLNSITIPGEHWKRNCRRSIKNHLIRLYQASYQQSGFSEALGVIIRKKLSWFLVDLSVLVEIKTGKILTHKDEIIAEAGTLGLNANFLRKMLDYKQGKQTLTSAELQSAFYEYRDQVALASELADKA